MIYVQTGTAAAVPEEYAIRGREDRIGTFYKQDNVYAYELRDVMGNVRAVIAQSGSTLEVRGYSDYYPYGMVLRSGGATYRYGYQGAYAQSGSQDIPWEFNYSIPQQDCQQVWVEDPPAPGGGGESTTIPQPSPCDQIAKANIQAKDATVKKQITDIKSKVSTNSNEFGYNENLKDWKDIGQGYKNTPSYTDSKPDFVGLGTRFTWNATDGYTIGTIHDHPNSGHMPTPDDIYSLIDNINNTQLSNAGQAAIDFYKANASVTVVASPSITYTVMVNDWSALLNDYNAYKANPKFLNDLTTDIANGDKNKFNSDMITLFGNAVNFYTDNGDGTGFHRTGVSSDRKSTRLLDCNL